jgi:DNA-binding beta-propeller fold protein YncE
VLGRTIVAVVAASVLGLADARAVTAPTSGVLAQLGGRNGCLYDPRGGSAQGLHVDLPGRCETAESLDGAYDAAMSPDGRHVYVASFQADSISAFARDARTGRLAQLVGASGCLVDDPFDSPCSAAPALDGVSGIGVSPDGRNVYAVSFFSHALVAFSRDRGTGELSPLEGSTACLAEVGSPYGCAAAAGLRGASQVALSPDGRNVYVSSALDSTVAVFRRDPATGVVRQLDGAAGCVRDWLLEVEADVCARTAGLNTASSVTVSPDGRSVYVSSFGAAAVAVFARDRTTGALTPLRGTSGCLSEGREDACASARGLEGAFAVSVSPDGRNVYVATGFDRRLEPESSAGAFGASGVGVFARNPSTGALRQLAGRAGCVSERPTPSGCADGRALEGAIAVEISRDGGNVYVAASASNAIGVFARNARTGALRQLAGRAGCVSESGTGGSCRDGTGLWGASAIALSPDGRHAYAPGFFSSAVTVFSRAAPARR